MDSVPPAPAVTPLQAQAARIQAIQPRVTLARLLWPLFVSSLITALLGLTLTLMLDSTGAGMLLFGWEGFSALVFLLAIFATYRKPSPRDLVKFNAETKEPIRLVVGQEIIALLISIAAVIHGAVHINNSWQILHNTAVTDTETALVATEPTLHDGTRDGLISMKKFLKEHADFNMGLWNMAAGFASMVHNGMLIDKTLGYLEK